MVVDHVHPGSFFTREQWDGPKLGPLINELRGTQGGIILIAVELVPTQNYPNVGFVLFNSAERKRVRQSLIRVMNARQKL